jgi:putative protease
VKKPELLAPGGSFLAAFQAFEAGADGVYLGLREFSARAAAQNFTLAQLRRIRQLAADRGKKIYVTLNTVVREEEMPRLRETLAWLEALRIDGVIVQDLGVCDMVRHDFPGLPIHASTQMGVHNDSGLEIAEQLGIRRAILARELSLERIRALRSRHPRMELEVFIHGALCYSFSGVCLASWALTGRSGNRGDCAQVCRSVFRADEASGGGEPAHLFSTRDLFLGRDVLKLAGIGIDALKIEGRMKSPEYVFNVTRLYREVLDRGDEIPAAEYEELVRRSELGFSRTRTSGWLNSALGSRVLEPGSPAHRGAFLGNVETVQGRQVVLHLEGDLSLHDGLAFIPEGSQDQIAFPVLRILKEGREVRFARPGETVSVEVPRDAAPAMPGRGQEMRQLSSRFLDLPQPREASFPMYKIPLDLRVTFGTGGLLTFETPGFPIFSRQTNVAPAAARKPFRSILAALLKESGESAFRPGVLSFTNNSGFPDDGIFVRPSELKKVKNDLYVFLDSAFPPREISVRGPEAVPERGRAGSPLGPTELEMLAHRGLISPPGTSPVPFVGGDPASLELSQLADLAGFRWLPLPPVLLDEAPWINAVRTLADRHTGTRIAVGLNNISHLAFASALSEKNNAWFFADFYLYAANDRTLSLLRSRVPRFLFAYEWLEDDRAGAPPGSATPLVSTIRLSADFAPPLFYSLACFTRHSVNQGRCVDGCPKDFSGELSQGRSRFRMLVRDCVTYLFSAPGRQSGATRPPEAATWRSPTR